MLLMVVPAGCDPPGEGFGAALDELDGGAGGWLLAPEAGGAVAEEVVEPPGAALETGSGAAVAVVAGRAPVPPHPLTAMSAMPNTGTVKTKKGTERISQF